MLFPRTAAVFFTSSQFSYNQVPPLITAPIGPNKNQYLFISSHIFLPNTTAPAFTVSQLLYKAIPALIKSPIGVKNLIKNLINLPKGLLSKAVQSFFIASQSSKDFFLIKFQFLYIR